MLRCGEQSGMFTLKHCNDCGDSAFYACNYQCNLRTCPDCAKKRQRRLFKKFYPMLQHKQVTRGSVKSLYFLTISPRNYSDFYTALKAVKVSWKRFFRSKYVRDRVDGGLWIIEAKSRNKQGECNGWNVHIHALFYGRRLDNSIRGKCLECNQSYIKCDKITKKFYCANRKCNSLNVLHNEHSKLVSIWRKSNKEDVHIDIQELKSSSGGLSYVLKYISSDKSDFASVGDFAKYISGIRKQKLINVFGDFFKYKFLNVCSCYRCGSLAVDFINDQAVIRAYIDARNKPPCPQIELK